MRRNLIAFSFLSIAAAQTYTYDAAGRLAAAAYPGGGGVRYEYDASDNMTAVIPLNLPAAPGGIQLTRESASANRVSWETVAGATGYIVERRVVGTDTWVQVAQVGSGARRSIEALFGEKVYLRLWVKVRGGWSDDEQALRELGYEDASG